ncbi:MAG: TlpA disulfide reductase family protein [Pseudomonadota bacterium]
MDRVKTAGFALALVALGAGAFLADRTLSEAPADAGQADAAPADASAGADEGQPMPAIALTGLDEATVNLADFKGQPLLVNFWATWCRPCRKEIPLLIELREVHAQDDLEIVGIAIDELVPTREMAQAFGIDYPIMVGEQEGIDAMVAFGAPTTALPFTAAVNRAGQIVAGHVGELTEEDAQRLLAEVL